jgi:hypothetical protein
MHEYGETWWNDVDKKNSLFVHQSANCQACQQSHLEANNQDLGEGNYGYDLRNISFILRRSF